MEEIILETVIKWLFPSYQQKRERVIERKRNRRERILDNVTTRPKGWRLIADKLLLVLLGLVFFSALLWGAWTDFSTPRWVLAALATFALLVMYFTNRAVNPDNK